jgi:hypothetical protein
MSLEKWVLAIAMAAAILIITAIMFASFQELGR